MTKELKDYLFEKMALSRIHTATKSSSITS
jgi:hypothetical protein